jgi:hypothetical protein
MIAGGAGTVGLGIGVLCMHIHSQLQGKMNRGPAHGNNADSAPSNPDVVEKELQELCTTLAFMNPQRVFPNEVHIPYLEKQYFSIVINKMGGTPSTVLVTITAPESLRKAMHGSRKTCRSGKEAATALLNLREILRQRSLPTNPDEGAGEESPEKLVRQYAA